MIDERKIVVKKIQDEVRDAIEKIATKHGMKIVKNRATYDSSMVRFSLELNAVDEKGENLKPAADFKLYCHLFELSPGDLGRQFTYGGRTFVISGLNLRSRTKPILAKDYDTGRDYIFRSEDVVRLLTATTPARGGTGKAARGAKA